MDDSHTNGVIFIAKKGTGYVKDERFTEDVEIERANLGTALNGDTVCVEILGKKGKRMAGAVESVLERVRTRFVGVLQTENGGYFLKPDNAKIHVDITLRTEDVKDIAVGTKLYVELEEWTNPKKSPVGNVLNVIGKSGEHEVEMQSIVFEHGFETSFASKIEEEAKDIAANKEISDADSERRDMRDVTTFTIDPFDAKDFDDALSIKYLDNGDVEIGIHIADVTHYVTPGSHLEAEARERATSIYLVDRTIPMLPEILSNDVCSLNPNEDRRTFSAVFVIDNQAGVKDRWFGETIIHSDKRFTYENAQDILNAGKGELYKELNTMNTLGKKLRKKRDKNGAISFETDEIQFKLDDKGVPLDVTRKKRQDTNKMIEDFMLLANEEVATYMFNNVAKKGKAGKDSTFVYRIHDLPNPDKIEELGIFIRALGYEFEAEGGKVSGKGINKLFDAIEGKPEEDLIKVATIRSMAKAIYSTKNVGHFGLAFKYYTHFTSPIRRYPDMMVHRIVKKHLNGEGMSDKETSDYLKMCARSSEREIEATRAERDSIKYKQVEYMLDKIGQEFDGTITGVTEWGIYVEDEHSKAEGLVRISNLGGDYYTLDKAKYRIVGERAKKAFALGDKVKIKLTAADLEAKTLDFVLV